MDYKLAKRRVPKDLLKIVLRMRSDYWDGMAVQSHSKLKGKNPCLVIPDELLADVDELIATYRETKANLAAKLEC